MKRLFIGFLISLFLISQGYCATGWEISKPAGDSNAADLDARIIENNTALDLALSYLRQGCKLTYSTVDVLTVAPGSLVVSNSGGTIRLMLAKTSSITMNWNVAENGLDAGAQAASTTYYVYAIASAVTDTAYTIKVTTNSTVPTGVTYYKRLGSFYNDSSSNITKISNDNTQTDWGVYDSGYFAVSNGNSYAKTHSLGTTKVLTLGLS